MSNINELILAWKANINNEGWAQINRSLIYTPP